MVSGSRIVNVLKRIRFPAVPDYELPAQAMQGYFAALGGGVAAFFAMPLIGTLITVITGSGDTSHIAATPEITTLQYLSSWLVTAGVLALGALMMATFGFIFTLPTFFIFSLIPAAFKVTHWLYFVVCGALIGVPISAFWAAGVSPFRQADAAHLWFWPSFWPVYPCGAVGGLTYWWIAINRPRRDTSPGQPQTEQP